MYESTTPALPMLSTLAVSLAMSTWSPVIIFTATPYLFASSIVCEVHTYIHHTYIRTYTYSTCLVSGLGGSRKVSSPRNSQRCTLPGTVFATARDRMPRRPNLIGGENI